VMQRVEKHCIRICSRKWKACIIVMITDHSNCIIYSMKKQTLLVKMEGAQIVNKIPLNKMQQK
jgi:hypothetical protein